MDQVDQTSALNEPNRSPLPGPLLSYGAAWTAVPAIDLLTAVAAADLGAVAELHRRYAPLLYALAGRSGEGVQGYLEPQVQAAMIQLTRKAHCHARSGLAAHVWILAVAQRFWTDLGRA